MAKDDPIPSQRLFVPDDLAAGRRLSPSEDQSHYLLNVLRLGAGDTVALFNGRDGEWQARIAEAGRKRCQLTLEQPLRPQAAEPDLWLIFAPIKRGRIEYLVEKATEIGASALYPVLTRRSIVDRVNPERLQAHAIEAAEQCERLTVPTLAALQKLDTLLAHWPADRTLIFCDERRASATLAEAAATLPKGAPLALLIGPEGGFMPEESAAVRRLPATRPVHLGPRLLRADTAAIAALSVLQAVWGDWTAGA